MRAQLEAVTRGQDLSREEARSLFVSVVRGQVDTIELSAWLAALKTKGESPAEIAGAAEALRQTAEPFVSRPPIVDCCGTGGDGAQTVNISTAVALVAAEAGLRIVKHGNRSVSSRCGSADVLAECGVEIECSAETSSQCLERVGICFLFAPQYHPGIRHAMPVRKALGIRTIFNVLGPLANPARPQHQLVGVYDKGLCRPMAETLQMLGCEAAMVVHGDGLDEIALHGPTQVAALRQGKISEFQLDPHALGLQRRSLADLRGGAADENAQWLRAVLSGRGLAAHNDAISINAGALLWIADRVADHAEGVARAAQVLASGRAADRLERWAELSRDP